MKSLIGGVSKQTSLFLIVRCLRRNPLTGDYDLAILHFRPGRMNLSICRMLNRIRKKITLMAYLIIPEKSLKKSLEGLVN